MKRSIQALMLAGALYFATSSPAEAQLAHPGYSGLVSTPTPEVLPEGSLALAFSWLGGTETYLRSPLTNRLYSISAGLLPGLEVTLRLTEMVGWYDPTVPGVTYGNDRMFSAKYQLPMLDTLPRAAVGMQDIASANVLAGIVTDDPREYYGHSMLYGVLGDTVGPWSWHLGGAFSRSFINGVFGGLSARILPGIHLLVEHDSKRLNWGVQICPVPSFQLKISRFGSDTWGAASTLVFQL